MNFEDRAALFTKEKVARRTEKIRRGEAPIGAGGETLVSPCPSGERKTGVDDLAYSDSHFVNCRVRAPEAALPLKRQKSFRRKISWGKWGGRRTIPSLSDAACSE